MPPSLGFVVHHRANARRELLSLTQAKKFFQPWVPDPGCLPVDSGTSLLLLRSFRPFLWYLRFVFTAPFRNCTHGTCRLVCTRTSAFSYQYLLPRTRGFPNAWRSWGHVPRCFVTQVRALHFRYSRYFPYPIILIRSGVAFFAPSDDASRRHRLRRMNLCVFHSGPVCLSV